MEEGEARGGGGGTCASPPKVDSPPKVNFWEGDAPEAGPWRGSTDSCWNVSRNGEVAVNLWGVSTFGTDGEGGSRDSERERFAARCLLSVSY